ncbi:MAG: hypothetical protein WCL39_03680 [Armatimonadota bacterium]
MLRRWVGTNLIPLGIAGISVVLLSHFFWRRIGLLWWQGCQDESFGSGIQGVGLPLGLIVVCCLFACLLCGAVYRVSWIVGLALFLLLIACAVRMCNYLGNSADESIRLSIHVTELAPTFISEKLMYVRTPLDWKPRLKGLSQPEVSFWFAPIEGGVLKVAFDNHNAFQAITLNITGSDGQISNRDTAQEYLESRGVWSLMASRVKPTRCGWQADLAFLHIILSGPKH